MRGSLNVLQNCVPQRKLSEPSLNLRPGLTSERSSPGVPLSAEHSPTAHANGAAAGGPEDTAALYEDTAVACGGLYIMVQVSDSSMRSINPEGLGQLHAPMPQRLSSTYRPFPSRDARFSQHAQ